MRCRMRDGRVFVDDLSRRREWGNERSVRERRGKGLVGCERLCGGSRIDIGDGCERGGWEWV